MQYSQAQRFEQQRITEIKQSAASMKGTLANKGRCPKCTLKPPCKHYENMDQLMSAQVTGQSTMQPVTNDSGYLGARNNQGTPDRGMFYPENSVVSGSGVSITTESNAKQQRSDGFSVTSHIKKPQKISETFQSSG
jgi:hypothetical protein